MNYFRDIISGSTLCQRLKRYTGLLAAGILLFAGSVHVQAQDGTAFIGEVRMFGGNFAPMGWRFCDGSLLSISENEALYAVLGTTYGGDGMTTFALPNLVGRVPLSPGQGPGLSNHQLGQSAGTETVTITSQQLPAHVHAMTATTGVKADEGNTNSPSGAYAASPGKNVYHTSATGQGKAQTVNTTAAGATTPAPVENRQPYLVVNYIICTEGIFPSQN